MKFINRELELESLKEAEELSKKKLYTVMVTGLRRVGKTRLLLNFLDNKGLYFFVNAKKSSAGLLEEYGEVLREKNLLGRLEKIGTWEDFFTVLFERFQGVVVFDEFQNFEAVDKSVAGILQKYIDLKEEQGGLLLIFSGSLIGLLKEMFSGQKEPLYGRVKRKLALKPLAFKDVQKMCLEVNIKSLEDVASLYGIFGGFPLYYVKIEDENLAGKSFEEIINKFFLKEGMLEDEVTSILSMEFGKRSGIYYSILEAIANGSRSLSEIAGYVGREQTKITRQLDELRNYFELVDFEEEVFSGKRAYIIKHPLVNFWFKFFNKRLSDYKRRDVELVDHIQKDLNSYLGRRFEILCREALIGLNLTFSPTKIGRHWGKIHGKPKGENAYEIDIVALNESVKEILFCECKWSDLKEAEARKVLEELKEKSKFVEWERKKEYFGLVGKKILGKEKLRKDGWFVWDLDDIEKVLKTEG